MSNSLEIKNLTKHYDTFCLDNVNMTIPMGCIMGFIGENGAGKTTTIKAILNQIKRDDGRIAVLGYDNIEQEKELKGCIGVVLDESMFPQALTPKQISAVMSGIYKSWDSTLYMKYVAQFKLPTSKPIKSFSKGMRMKLGISTALAHHPKLLILDEATSGLDPVVRSEILDLFLDFIQDDEHSILISSHITSDIEKIADYITFIHQGKIMLSVDKDSLIYSYGIAKCGHDMLSRLDPSVALSYQESQFGCEVLVNNKDLFNTLYPEIVVDNASIDDIFVLSIKGKKIA